MKKLKLFKKLEKKKNVEIRVANKNSEKRKNIGTKNDGLQKSQKSIKPSAKKLVNLIFTEMEWEQLVKKKKLKKNLMNKQNLKHTRRHLI